VYKIPYGKRRTLALSVGSILIYAFAVELSEELYGLLHGPFGLGFDTATDTAIVVSGLIGALLVGGMVQVLASFSFAWKIWLLLSFVGLLGGFAFSFTYDSTNAPIVALGYGAWQLPVCFVLNMGSRNVI
jgi:hypothetical protein